MAKSPREVLAESILLNKAEGYTTHSIEAQTQGGVTTHTMQEIAGQAVTSQEVKQEGEVWGIMLRKLGGDEEQVKAITAFVGAVAKDFAAAPANRDYKETQFETPDGPVMVGLTNVPNTGVIFGMRMNETHYKKTQGVLEGRSRN